MIVARLVLLQTRYAVDSYILCFSAVIRHAAVAVAPNNWGPVAVLAEKKKTLPTWAVPYGSQ